MSIYMRDFSETFNYSHTLEDINAYLDFQTPAVETWKEQYLSTQARQSSVETFSALQVRSEITPPPRPKWQSYAKHLSRFD